MRRLLTLLTASLILQLMLTGCASTQKLVVKEVREKTHAAVTPVPIPFKEVEAWYDPRQAAVNARLKEGNVDLLFVGNSIMNGWDGPGKKYWDEYYAPRNAVNLGFGWDWTQHVLWRLDHTEFGNITPKLAVVLIGTNNSNGEDNTAEEIADGIIAVCDRLHTRFPEMKILLLAIFPRQEKPCPQRTKVAEASLLASRIADNKTIFYMDLAKLFLLEDGAVNKNFMPDYLHPNAEGYRLWAEDMEPKIVELMGEKK